MTQFLLKGKNCLVVGAGSGLGYELALNLIRLDCKVILASRNVEDLKEQINNDIPIKQKGNILVRRVDVTKTKNIEKLIRFVKENFGQIDVLINSAGIAAYKRFVDLSDLEIEKVINTNLTGAINLFRRSLTLMQDGKSLRWIIQIGSLAGDKVGHNNFSVYSASKQGLVGLFRSLICEVNGRRIKLVLVHPPAFNSKLSHKAIGSIRLIQKFNKSQLEETRDVALRVMEVFKNNSGLKEGFRFYP